MTIHYMTTTKCILNNCAVVEIVDGHYPYQNKFGVFIQYDSNNLSWMNPHHDLALEILWQKERSHTTSMPVPQLWHTAQWFIFPEQDFFDPLPEFCIEKQHERHMLRIMMLALGWAMIWGGSRNNRFLWIAHMHHAGSYHSRTPDGVRLTTPMRASALLQWDACHRPKILAVDPSDSGRGRGIIYWTRCLQMHTCAGSDHRAWRTP